MINTLFAKNKTFILKSFIVFACLVVIFQGVGTKNAFAALDLPTSETPQAEDISVDSGNQENQVEEQTSEESKSKDDSCEGEHSSCDEENDDDSENDDNGQENNGGDEGGAENTTPQNELAPCVDMTASVNEVVSVVSGTRNDGAAITDPNAINSYNAINDADGAYYSTGKGGTIILSFAGYAIDVPGVDLTLHEITSNPNSSPEEKATVAISQNGTDWHVLGVAKSTDSSGNSSFDVSSSGLSWFTMVKITDATDYTGQAVDADGYDLDAVSASYQSCFIVDPFKEGEYDMNTGKISYDIFWEVIGEGEANITLSDILPAGVEYVEASADNNGQYDSENRTLTWSLESKASGESGHIKFQVTVNNLDVCEIQNTAYLTWPILSGDEVVAITESSLAKNTINAENCNSQGGGGETGGQTNTGSITGVVFNDGNSNAVMDEGEAQLSGWVVYLDTNDNGNLDSGEPTKTTASPYVFSNLADGTYTVREVVQDGWSQTLPTSPNNFKYTVTISGGAAITGKNFGNYQRPGGGSVGASSVADGGTTGGNGGGSSSGNGNGSNGAGTPQVLGDSTGTGLQMPEAQPKVLGATELPRTGVPLWVYLAMVMLVSSLVAIPTVTSQVKKSAVKI